MSLRECLAILMGSGPPGLGAMGVADQILEKPGTGLSSEEQARAFFTGMEGSGASHLMGIRGLGDANRARILAAFEIGRRYSFFREPGPASSSGLFREKKASALPEQALAKISPSRKREPREWLGFVPLHRSGKVGDLCVVEEGVRTHVNVDPAELFARVLALRPSGFFLVHNHPSGDCSPSGADLILTERVEETAISLGVRLLGHWIVAPQGEFLVESRSQKRR